MSQAKIHLQSFNSGELSETMANRFGVEKVASGCRLLRNMLPHVHGPAVKRPGTTYQGFAGHNTQAPRLLEFNFSATTRFCLEFSTSTIRVWSGQTGQLQSLLATVSHPYSYSETWDVQARQVNDVVYLVHPSYAPRVLTRKADNDWTLAEVDWAYPPMLDEYFLDETRTLPAILPVWESGLNMAPEFTVPPLPANENPWMQSEPSGALDSAWFQVNAGQATGATGIDCTMQVVNTAGAWVDVVAIAVSTGATSDPVQFSFQPAATVTSLVARRRTFTGGSWGAWSTAATVVLVLPAGSTVANMPALQFRFVVGPVTRATFATTPSGFNITPITGASGPLIDRVSLSGYQSFNLKYDEALSGDITVTWSMPATVPSGRTMLFQRWSGAAWVTLTTFTLAASMPTRTFRLRRSGANILWEEKGATTYSTLTTTASTDNGPWTLRLLTASDSLAGTATVSFTLPNYAQWHAPWSLLSVTREISRSPSAAANPNTGGYLLAANQRFQFFAALPADEDLPAGAEIILQRRTGEGAWSVVKRYSLAAQVGVSIQEEFAPYAEAVSLRALYSSTSGQSADGTMRIETVTYPFITETKLQVNATNGTGRTMTSTAAVFQAGHVGSFWQIAQRRDTSLSQIIGVVGVFPVAKRTSREMRIIGRWDVTTYGTWRGNLYLERRTAANEWTIERTWTSNKDRNIVASDVVEHEGTFRLRVANNMTGFAASGADVPRFVLEAADSRAYGIVQVTGFTSSTQVTVNVIRPLHSTEPTALWSEGAFSSVRGFPAALAIHEGRMWYAGTSFQPSALFASVSNDLNNFRRSTNDDGSFLVALAAETGSAIRWLSNADDALLIGTGGEEWAIRSNVEGQPLTPTNIRAGRRGAYSSAPLQARVSQDATLFVQRNRRKLRQASYSSTDGAFQASDMTVLAPHVTEAGIVQFAIQQAPWNVIWCVLSDGKLASMTFEREQNVFAWALHETNGAVKSIAILTGEQTDQIWLSVERAGRAMIERFDAAAMIGGSSGWQSQAFCDSALKLTGPATTFTVAHLPSRAVVGLADGIPFTANTNGIGVFTLAAPATSVVVGQAFESTLQPMRIDLQMQDGTSQARRIRVSRVGVRVIDSRSGQVADGTDGTFETLEYDGSGLFSGMVEAAIESRSDSDMNVVVKDSAPLPFTVAALVLKGDVYGD